MSTDWPFTWEGTASIPSPLRTVCGHAETQVALLTPGVGKLSCRIHWRGAATNRAMPYLLACAGETKVSTAEGGSEGRLQPQREGRRGACIKWVHSPTPGTAEMPFATGNGQKAGKKLVHPGPRFEKSHQPAQVAQP